MATRVSYPVELKMKAIVMRLAEVPVSKWRITLLRATGYVEGQEHGPIESRYYSGFFILSVQVLVFEQIEHNSYF
ncbi:hypothetical protein J7E78_03155 [Paenibacillus polymyxa]|uniref:hypothetical protein n=1 Tax=Paenibacillus polymyxa TaxID=1406 RepID=UPI001BECC1EB|nr:hypothetical protein [Paenibacillus polymyxa]MBT2282538.1 hypothetical protein [Paenibacillus polymyxa]